MPEIAEAFVRVRPDTRNFKSETRAGIAPTLKSGALGFAGITAGFLAISEGGKILREGVQGAGQVQKALESMDQVFGESGEQIKTWADTTAASFGISEEAADKTAVKIGLLGENLHIAAPKAASMALGLEKIVGAVGEIKDVDPQAVLAKLPLVLAGNLRSLKELGFTFSTAQIHEEAFKEGLVSLKGALGPAAKAQAIYSLLMERLPQLLQQASQHSGDLINKQHQLTAEWQNAQEKLGQALLPSLTRLTTYLADNIPHAADQTAHGFHVIAQVLSPLIYLTHGYGNALKALALAYTAAKLASLATSFRTVAASEGAAAASAGALGTRLRALPTAIGITVTIAYVVAKQSARLSEFLQGRFPGVFGRSGAQLTWQDVKQQIDSGGIVSEAQLDALGAVGAHPALIARAKAYLAKQVGPLTRRHSGSPGGHGTSTAANTASSTSRALQRYQQLQLDQLAAQRTASLSDDLAVAKAIAEIFVNRVKTTKFTGKQLFQLKQQEQQALNDVASIEDQIHQQALSAAQKQSSKEAEAQRKILAVRKRAETAAKKAAKDIVAASLGAVAAVYGTTLSGKALKGTGISGGGATVTDFYNAAIQNFAAYGSNIADNFGGVLSPQDERGVLAGLELAGTHAGFARGIGTSTNTRGTAARGSSAKATFTDPLIQIEQQIAREQARRDHDQLRELQRQTVLLRSLGHRPLGSAKDAAGSQASHGTGG